MELSSFLTIGFVVIIAVERFLLVHYPLSRVSLEQKLRHSLVVVNVIVAIGTTVPYTLGVDVDTDGRCVMFTDRSRDIMVPYQIFVLVVYSVLPVTITTVIYLAIARSVSDKKLHKQFSNSRSDGFSYILIQLSLDILRIIIM